MWHLITRCLEGRETGNNSDVSLHETPTAQINRGLAWYSDSSVKISFQPLYQTTYPEHQCNDNLCFSKARAAHLLLPFLFLFLQSLGNLNVSKDQKHVKLLLQCLVVSYHWWYTPTKVVWNNGIEL